PGCQLDLAAIEAGHAGDRLDRIAPTFPGRPFEAAHDLPHVRAACDPGPPSRRARAEHDSRKLLGLESLVDQPFGDPRLGFADTAAVRLQLVDDLCGEPCRERPGPLALGHYLSCSICRTM